MPSALKTSKEHTNIPYKNHSVEFTLPDPKNTADKYIRDSHTNNYTKIPDEKHLIGDKVSNTSYVYTSTPEPSKKRKRETFEDICEGKYNYYLCIFFIYMIDMHFFISRISTTVNFFKLWRKCFRILVNHYLLR